MNTADKTKRKNKTKQKTPQPYLVYLHGPLHPLLGGAEYLVQPVGQSLSEAFLKVCQLKNSPKIAANPKRFYPPLTESITSDLYIIYFKLGVWLLTCSVRKPCLSGYSEGSGKQGTGCWPDSAPCDL